MQRLWIILAGCVLTALSLMAVVAQASANDTKAVRIQISATGNWSGFYVNQDSRINLNGSGTTQFQLTRPSNATVWNIIVRIYEIGRSNYTLIVRILRMDGQVLDEDFASTRGASALATFTITPVFCFE